MPIPPHTIDGILPPFVGRLGPGDNAEHMTPYAVTAEEVAARFGTSERRHDILKGWLDYRAALRGAGFVAGFQWLDGSFVEDKVPNDIDVVTFARRPPALGDPAQRAVWIATHGYLYKRPLIKWLFKVDAFPIDLDGNSETLVEAARYFGGLFSHRRGDGLWKGMLSVRLEDPLDDQAALAVITPPLTAGAPGAGP